MSGTGPISAAPPPADSSSGHAAMDSHHSGQTHVVTTVAVPHVQIRWVNRANRPSAPALGGGGGGRGLASPETHHPPHPSLAQIFQQCIPRAPSLDFRSGP